jgi:integrase
LRRRSANTVANPLPLKIVWFKNPSKQLVPRVTGTLPSGERVRKNFADETAARIYLNERCAGLLSPDTPKPVITSLPESVVRQAEAALMRLPAGTDLLQAVDFFAEFHRPLAPVAYADAVKKYGDWLTTQRKNMPETKDARVGVLTQFGKNQKIDRSDRITLEKARAWIYEEGKADVTQRDRFDLLLQFCGWLAKKQNKLAAWNPIEELDRPVVRIDAPGVLTFTQVQTLLQCALTDPEGPEMLPFFAICVLSGVRPDEAPRLTWANIHLDTDHRIIEVNKAKGGRTRRQAAICEPLAAILQWCKVHELGPGYYSRRKFDRVRKLAGVYDLWEKDLLRHTYASHHYILHKDMKTLPSVMGNSERVLFQNYIRPVPKADAEALFSLALDYTAPRQQGGQSLRRDLMLKRGAAALEIGQLRVLRTGLLRDMERLKRTKAPAGEVAALAEKLRPIEVALENKTRLGV